MYLSLKVCLLAADAAFFHDADFVYPVSLVENRLSLFEPFARDFELSKSFGILSFFEFIKYPAVDDAFNVFHANNYATVLNQNQQPLSSVSQC